MSEAPKEKKPEKKPAKKASPADKSKKEREKKDATIDALVAEVASLKDTLLREQAEMVNFKRRLTEEKIKDRQYANADVFKSILPVLDHFDMLIKNEKAHAGFEAFEPAITKLYDNFITVFKDLGLEEVMALDAPFNPAVHEAVMQEAREEKAPNTVIEVFQKGYTYKERLLRPAMVKVSE